MKFTENMLNEYSQPLSITEDTQCKNAISMVADALKKYGLSDDGNIQPLYPDTYAYSLRLRNADNSRNVKIFVQGSYANNTNVRANSDVDIAVIQEEIFRTEYRKDLNCPQSDKDYGFVVAPASTKSFKDEVQQCLELKFGSDVKRKNKSIKVDGNSYRKDADTVPCLRYRNYTKDYSYDAKAYIGGVVIYPDDGGSIINYPEQHIDNGRRKNDSTNHYYKKMVRIMKKMRYLMEDSQETRYKNSAEKVSSFMLESLLWNIDDSWYLSYCPKYRKVFVFKKLIELCQQNKPNFWIYKEANGIKHLCSSSEDFGNLCAFIDQLALFYDYDS